MTLEMSGSVNMAGDSPANVSSTEEKSVALHLYRVYKQSKTQLLVEMIIVWDFLIKPTSN